MTGLLRKLLHPFPQPPLVAGQLYSKLEAEAEACGVAQIEATFRNSAPVRAISDALCRFFDDPEAERALKKAYHIAFEQRLRVLALAIDPPGANGLDALEIPDDVHPLDRAANAVLQTLDRRAPAERGRLGLLARALDVLRPAVWTLALCGASLGYLLRFGTRGEAARPVRVLACDSWYEARWLHLRRAAQDHGIWRDGDLVVLLGRAPVSAFKNLPTVRLATLPVPYGAWLREVVLPSFGLAGRLAAIMLRGGANPTVREAVTQALRLAAGSLDLRRVAYALKPAVWLDDAEHDPRHILKAIVVRKAGGRLARLPHTEIDTRGTSLSYLGYDDFYSAGVYQAENLAESWYPKLRNVPIGLLQHDRRFRAAGAHIDTEYHREIAARISAGKKMLAFFGPSDIPGVARFTRDLVASLVALVTRHDDWFLVVKPKLKDEMYAILASDPRCSALADHPSIVCIRYPQPGVELCPSGWLMEHMVCGAGGLGSAQVEALTMGRPYFAYFPVAAHTPYKAALRADGLLNTDVDRFEAALDRFMGDPNPDRFKFAWYQSMFDPYGDDDSLGRLARHLFADRKAGIEDEPTRRARVA